uniref:Uncharacterized protein n=1 Tax=viral metagenome TaxID=1070528 RepID=A0A6C0DMQ7_9ZZZZ
MSSYDAAILNNSQGPFHRSRIETERRANLMKEMQEREDRKKQLEEKWAAEDAIKKGEKDTWKTVGKSWWEKGGKSKKLSQTKKGKTLRKKRKPCKK